MTIDDDRRVSLWTKLCYGSGLFGVSAAQIAVSTLLLYFYTDVMRFKPADAGILMFIGGLTDCAANLLAAKAATLSWSRLGQYRPFLIYGAVPFGLAFAAMFMKPGLSPTLLFLFAMVTHIAYRASYAFIAVPHASLLTRMSLDANERASIAGMKTAGGGVGTVFAGYVGLGMIAWIGGHNEVHGFTLFALITGVAIALSVFTSGYFTGELAVAGKHDAERHSFLASMAFIGRNPALVSLLLANVLFFICYSFLFGGAAYYFKYIYGDTSHTKDAVVAIAIGTIVFPTIWTAIARYRSKRFTWIAACALMAAAFCALDMMEHPAIAVVLLVYLVLGACKASMVMNGFSMTADAVDYGQWRQQRRIEAYSFGIVSLSSKLGLALGGGLMGLCLGWAGFHANVAQSAATVANLRTVIFLVPASIGLASAAAISFFLVSNQLHRRIADELFAMADVEAPVE